jgi:hypothetical protein
MSSRLPLGRMYRGAKCPRGGRSEMADQANEGIAWAWRGGVEGSQRRLFGG